jgi:hypothetical protein
VQAEKDLQDTGAIVVAVSILPKESRERVERIVQEKGAEAFVVGYADQDTKQKMNERDGDGATGGYPYTVFIDKHGNARGFQRGAATRDDFVSGVRAMTK